MKRFSLMAGCLFLIQFTLYNAAVFDPCFFQTIIKAQNQRLEGFML